MNNILYKNCIQPEQCSKQLQRHLTLGRFLQFPFKFWAKYLKIVNLKSQSAYNAIIKWKKKMRENSVLQADSMFKMVWSVGEIANLFHKLGLFKWFRISPHFTCIKKQLGILIWDTKRTHFTWLLRIKKMVLQRYKIWVGPLEFVFFFFLFFFGH